MPKQALEIFFGPGVIKIFAGHVLCFGVEVIETLTYGQGVPTLVHADSVDYFWVIGVIL